MTPEQTASTYDKIASHWDCAELGRYGIAQHVRYSAVVFILADSPGLRNDSRRMKCAGR